MEYGDGRLQVEQFVELGQKLKDVTKLANRLGLRIEIIGTHLQEPIKGDLDNKEVPQNGEYIGLKLSDAIACVLEQHSQPMRCPEIFEALEAGGSRTTSVHSIPPAMSRDSRFCTVSRGLYGLVSWQESKGVIAQTNKD